MADFLTRTKVLEDMVGHGDLVGEFAVEKVYAAVQHEGQWADYMGRFGPKEIRRHTNGRPVPSKFVEAPLKANYLDYYQNLADGVLDGTLVERMKENAEDQDDQLQVYAPEDSGDLKRAGSCKVFDGGEIAHSKDSAVPYESEDQDDPPGFVLGFLKRGYA